MPRIIDKLTAWTRIGNDVNPKIIRKAFEEFYGAFDEIIRVLLEKTTLPTPPFQAMGGTPNLQAFPYPYVVLPSAQVIPSGVLLLPDASGSGMPCLITWMELLCDPNANAPSADTTFVLGNASSAPTKWS